MSLVDGLGKETGPAVQANTSQGFPAFYKVSFSLSISCFCQTLLVFLDSTHTHTFIYRKPF